MSTDTLPWFTQANIDSPWRQLHWTLPLALSICAFAFQQLPVIPDDLLQEAMSAVAKVRFQIAEDGSATIELTKPTQNPRLNRLLLDALRNWKFSPAMKDGKPIASEEVRVVRVQVK
ncbi:MAG TPA: TonB family protein [Gallionellaceae bacterium]|nr:TonB family protein [Gallionellaceae bacterium]